MYSFSLPKLSPDSEVKIMKDLNTLIQLCCQPHLASNLEISVKTKDDLPVTKLFSYMALWKARMPKVIPEAFK